MIRRLAASAGGLGLVAVLASTAAAQSKRYPPEPTDRDAIADAQSRLWDAASDPERAPYESMLALARQELDGRTPDHVKRAIAQLDQAVALLPTDPRAYQMRGEARMYQQGWVACADDLASAWTQIESAASAGAAGAEANLPDEDARVELRRQLGLCQARAGRYVEAERTLAEAAASGTADSEVWMRLGEVRIAMGKLDEAIAALGAARDSGDIPLAAWLLAGAYDRARRPAEALEWARVAIGRDRSLSTLRSPAWPLLGDGESMYLLGLASSAQEPPNPEAALAYFRKFVQLAPRSPWRKRAEEHLHDLAQVKLPETVQKLSGNAALAPALAETAIERAMPGMRACLAKLPYVVLGVRTTKLGPRSQPKARPDDGIYEIQSPFDSPYEHRRPVKPPPAPKPTSIYVQLEPVDTELAPQAEVDAAIRCVEPQVAKLALPVPKEIDSYYTLFFRVVAP